MNPSYKEIAGRIRSEVSDLGIIIERALKSWAKTQRMPDEQDIYLDSVALNLHGFYSGVERLFELIVRHVDRSIPAGKTWHRDMLMQISEASRLRYSLELARQRLSKFEKNIISLQKYS